MGTGGPRKPADKGIDKGIDIAAMVRAALATADRKDAPVHAMKGATHDY